VSKSIAGMKARAASVPLGTTILVGPPALVIFQPLPSDRAKIAIRVQLPQWVQSVQKLKCPPRAQNVSEKLRIMRVKSCCTHNNSIARWRIIFFTFYQNMSFHTAWVMERRTRREQNGSAAPQ
jgi:hypothetical protein